MRRMSDLSDLRSRSMRRRVLENLETRLGELPMLAAIASRVSQLDSADDSLALQIEEAARMDPPLSFRIVRLASNPDATSITKALDKLGASQLSEAVSKVVNLESFVPAAPALRNLWLHALQVAGLASATAALNPDTEVDPAEAYLIGLLHDIGHFVLYHACPFELDQIAEREWTSGRELLGFELETCGIDHAELGWRASLQWEIPDSITTLVRDHHAYKTAMPSGLKNLMAILRLADVTSFVMLNEPSWTQRSLEEMRVGIRQTIDHAGGLPFTLDVDQYLGQIRLVDSHVQTVARVLFPSDSHP